MDQVQPGERTRYVSTSTVGHTTGGETQEIYGAIGVRYWLGTPGESELISGSALFWEPIRVEDKTEFEAQIRLALRQEIARRLEAGTGLIKGPDQLEGLEWLVIWTAELDTIQRIRAFEHGWGRVIQGKAIKDLKSPDLARLARISGAKPRRGSVAE